ncbi:hypothetical protein RB595_008084 [Gaeumannomyces hyphopodioides]
MAFYRLPIELRYQVWEMTMEDLDDTPGVYLFDPFHHLFQHPIRGALPPNDRPTHVPAWNGRLAYTPTPIVPQGMPAALHVCAESRSVAQRVLRFTEGSLRDARTVAVPARGFNPEIDAMFLNPYDILTFIAMLVMLDPNHPRPHVGRVPWRPECTVIAWIPPRQGRRPACLEPSYWALIDILDFLNVDTTAFHVIPHRNWDETLAQSITTGRFELHDI